MSFHRSSGSFQSRAVQYVACKKVLIGIFCKPAANEMRVLLTLLRFLSSWIGMPLMR